MIIQIERSWFFLWYNKTENNLLNPLRMKSEKTQMTHVRNKNISDIFSDMQYLKVDHECLFQQSYASNLIGKEKGHGKSSEILNRGSGSSGVRHLPSICKDLGSNTGSVWERGGGWEGRKGEGTGRGTERKIIDLSKDIKSVVKILLSEKTVS